MAIRTTLLSAFLALSLISTLITIGVAFYKARQTLRVEIKQTLEAQAETLIKRIDATLFERIENVHSWSRLQIMQDMSIQDVDKRLSQFLDELNRGYAGIYTRLFTIDLQQRIIADSDRKHIGQFWQPGAHWLDTQLLGTTISLEALPLQIPDQPTSLHIHTALRDESRQVMGELYASFDWSEIIDLLTAPISENYGQQIELILIDAHRRIIATSPTLRERSLLQQKIPESWPTENNKGAFTSTHSLISDSDLLIGYANSQGYRLFPGFDWSILVIQPSSQAFAPIWDLWLNFLGFLFLITGFAGLVSLLISSKLARPIMQLTDYTRKACLEEPMPHLAIEAGGEVGELAEAYAQMLQDLEKSRVYLIRASKLAVIGEMAASMAHEVRTPLGILRSSAQMLQREKQLSPAGLEMTAFIVAESDRLNDLITTLLECARPHPPQFESYDIHIILTHVVELLTTQARQRSITLDCQYQATRSQLPCDKDQITQVFLNLIINALQWSPDEGTVTIYTHSTAQQLDIKICDNGPGIGVDDPQQVFEPFFNRREGGIGLGLTVVQQIVLAHKGEIEVGKHNQRGACFQVSLLLDKTEKQE